MVPAPDQRTQRAEATTDAGLRWQVRADLDRLHSEWMALAFPRQREPHPVLGRWRPSTVSERVRYRLWTLFGAAVVGALYPLAVAGLAVRFHSRRLARLAAALGPRRVVLLTGAVWGLLTLVVYLLGFPLGGVVAVGAGASVAAVSAALATVAWRRGGRASTVLLAYPLGVTTLFLPPVVAALYSQTVAGLVLPNSYLLAVWLLDNPLSVGGLATYLRAQFELAGVAYVGMWLAISVPVGWALGLLVTLASLVRPVDAS